MSKAPIYVGDPQSQAVIDARHEFILKYMAEKGWGADPEALSLPQILEIRAQKEWKEAGQ